MEEVKTQSQSNEVVTAGVTKGGNVGEKNLFKRWADGMEKRGGEARPRKAAANYGRELVNDVRSMEDVLIFGP